MSLRNFILTEKLSHDHAERYLTYIDKYHALVWTDLIKILTTAWEAEVKKLNQVEPISDLVTARELRSPGSSSEIQLITHPEKVFSISREPKIVSPSVKIPHVYHHVTIDHLSDQLLTVAEIAFKKTAKKWSKIFNYERRGKIVPSFEITRGSTVKFKIASSINGQEAYRTIYSVNIEVGRSGSKTKDFDRVYLLSHV